MGHLYLWFYRMTLSGLLLCFVGSATAGLFGLANKKDLPPNKSEPAKSGEPVKSVRPAVKPGEQAPSGEPVVKPSEQAPSGERARSADPNFKPVKPVVRPAVKPVPSGELAVKPSESAPSGERARSADPNFKPVELAHSGDSPSQAKGSSSAKPSGPPNLIEGLRNPDRGPSLSKVLRPLDGSPSSKDPGPAKESGMGPARDFKLGRDLRGGKPKMGGKPNFVLEEEDRPPFLLDSQEEDVLENTRIGKAVLEGSATDYKEAFYELIAVFGISVPELLLKKTSDGRTLDNLMVIAPTNKEYFAVQLIHLLSLQKAELLKQGATFANLGSSASGSDGPVKVGAGGSHSVAGGERQLKGEGEREAQLLKVAKVVGNELVFQLLTDFRRYEQEIDQAYVKEFVRDLGEKERDVSELLIRQKELLKAAINIAENSTYNVSLGVSGLIRLVIGVSVLGLGATSVLSLDLVQQAEALKATVAGIGPVKLISAGVALSASTVLIMSGLNRCAKAFRKRQALKHLKSKAGP